jgi:hypothetical protein
MHHHGKRARTAFLPRRAEAHFPATRYEFVFLNTCPRRSLKASPCQSLAAILLTWFRLSFDLVVYNNIYAPLFKGLPIRASLLKHASVAPLKDVVIRMR